MLASSLLSLPESSPRRFLAALGFVGVVAVAALASHEALLRPTPQQDEPDFVEAAELVAAGRRPTCRRSTTTRRRSPSWVRS